MKVLYIGVYKDGTGYGKMAQETILAMDAVGIDVVPRAIKLNKIQCDIPQRILELEKKSIEGCDHCIQNVLPHHIDYNGKLKKNIAFYQSETSNFKASSWANRLNCMDEVWVTCENMKQAAINSGVDKPIRIIPIACDVQKYQKQHTPIDIPYLKDKFVFYTIGEFANRRKNLPALLKAFHCEFMPEEPVALLIKAFSQDNENFGNLENVCTEIKRGLKLYPDIETYHNEIVITQYFTEEQMMQIHATGNCFVLPSYGEGWCLPAFDAMAMGKAPICTNFGGPKDFLFNNAGFLIDGQMEPVFGMTDTFSDVYTGWERWCSIDIIELQRTMRKVYELNENAVRHTGINRAYLYSYPVVGEKIKEVLCSTSQ